MNARGQLPFERFRYWQGQLLQARDLRDQLADAGRQAEWHNRAVHSAFGIRFGFEVTRSDTSPDRVSIACGIAFDCAGAMLVLQRPREVPLPALSAGASVVLLVRSRDGGCSCGCSGAAWSVHGEPLEAGLAFSWSGAFHGHADAGVPLVRIRRDTAGELVLDRSIRILTRPMARPHLGSGSTIPGVVPWEPWARGMQTRIDTSAIGFTRVPGYFAALNATREPSPGAWARLVPRLMKTYVADPSLNGFTFRIVGAALPAAMPELTRDFGLTVCWLGCHELELLPHVCPGQVPLPEPCTDDSAIADDSADGGCDCGCGCGCHSTHRG